MPKFSTGAGYTLYQSPFFSEAGDLRWYSTLTMHIALDALGNNTAFSVSFPIAFSSDVDGVISDTDGQAGPSTGTQDLGTSITEITTTGVTGFSRWQARPKDFNPIRFIITGVING